MKISQSQEAQKLISHRLESKRGKTLKIPEDR